MLITRILCMKCYALYTEIPHRQEPYIKPWMPSSRAKGSTLSDLRNLCGKGLAVGNGTDEGEVTEYLGCELIRNRSAQTAN